MSKNVAVFVDVANIFYAAKAAGVDIDYVTLLKSASAGRDLVRAYAYTGLDPENENQRQFHSFLGRNGYKVVSKDIRKYGDGKVKANLDIELVVDLMRTSHNLDIAVVVSGDGDFAPAIRAVQQTGVRVEVISFRGNTSSDLIEVADVFTDITQIARVERSSRSGRRVAAEEDLSMTEVPEKETEGAAQRRRRTRRGEGRDERRDRGDRGERREREESRDEGWRERRPAAAPAGAQPMIVLPGEKLSKVAPPVAPAIEEDVAAAELAEEPVHAYEGEAGEAGDQEAGRRRRRRRGGRGRGRGRGGEAVPATGVPAEEGEVEEEPELEAPRVPQHSTFGSVWDSQLGMPTAPVAPVSGDLEDEELEEPEIPEYLLAERRQRGRGGRGGGVGGGRRGGGRGSAYQQAVERERFGRGTGAPVGGAPRRDQRGERGGRPSFDRDRADRQRPPREPQIEERSPGGEPWSEVPPEVAELLRAELARRGGAVEGRAPERREAPQPARGETRGRRGRREPLAEPSAEAGAPGPEPRASATAPEAAENAAPVVTPSRARRGRRAAPESVDAAPEAAAALETPAPEAPRARRGRRTAAAVETAVAGSEPAEAAPAPARTPRRRAGAAAQPTEASATETEAVAGQAATPRRRTRRAADSAAAEASTAGEATPAGTGGAEAPAPRRRTRRTASPEA